MRVVGKTDQVADTDRKKAGPMSATQRSRDSSLPDTCHPFGKVVEVTAHAPPPREKQEAGLLLAVGCDILSLEALCFLTPDPAIALALTELLLLPVRLVVDVDATQSHQEQRGCPDHAEVVRVVHEIKGVASVEGGHPDKTSPADVEARAVVRMLVWLGEMSGSGRDFR